MKVRGWVAIIFVAVAAIAAWQFLGPRRAEGPETTPGNTPVSVPSAAELPEAGGELSAAAINQSAPGGLPERVAPSPEPPAATRERSSVHIEPVAAPASLPARISEPPPPTEGLPERRLK